MTNVYPYISAKSEILLVEKYLISRTYRLGIGALLSTHYSNTTNIYIFKDLLSFRVTLLIYTYDNTVIKVDRFSDLLSITYLLARIIVPLGRYISSRIASLSEALAPMFRNSNKTLPRCKKGHPKSLPMITLIRHMLASRVKPTYVEYLWR